MKYILSPDGISARMSIIQKLGATGLHSHILKWVQSYLTQRSQRVVVGGESSPPLPVLPGVPMQRFSVGTLAVPHLHQCINDVANLAFSSGTFLNLFFL